VIARSVRAGTLLILVGAWALLLVRVHDFARERFFTIDEWQFGHAAWLVSRGERPYVDFYEHHFPLAYTLHAPLLLAPGSFPDKALRLRSTSFAWACLLSLVLAGATWRATREPATALLAGILPLGVGFGLMSLVDFRADNFAACLVAAALALADANRREQRAGVAFACGVLVAAAIGMTQKAVYLGAFPFALIAFANRGPWSTRREPLLARPVAIALGAAALGALGLAAAAAWGVLGAGFELAVLEAVRHEAVYPDIPLSATLLPALRATPLSSAGLAALAAVFLLSREGRFWRLALVGVAFGVSLITARYPYNAVLACLLVGLCAARGAGLAARRLPLERLRLEPLRPALPLAALALLPGQLAFVAGTSTNEHQLLLLERIERFGTDDDAVIDNAGGALFRPHGSFYWYQGGAQRTLYADHFEKRLADDYRASRALFWIRDLRLRWLPAPVQLFFREHYVRLDGDLFGLGFRTPRTLDGTLSLPMETLRAGRYHVFVDPASPDDGAPPDGRVWVDDVPVEGGAVRLDAGRHEVRIEKRSPPYVLTPLPPEAFAREIGERRHSPLFEYTQRARALLGEDGAP
jgi:hypothetical protein